MSDYNVVFVEYAKEGKQGWLPFRVLTQDDPTKDFLNEWMFQWSRKDESLYCRQVGSNWVSKLYFNGVEGSRFWTSLPLPDSAIAQMEQYKIRRIKDLPGDPFAGAIHGGTDYCRFCGCVGESMCEHLVEVESHGEPGGTGADTDYAELRASLLRLCDVYPKQVSNLLKVLLRPSRLIAQSNWCSGSVSNRSMGGLTWDTDDFLWECNADGYEPAIAWLRTLTSEKPLTPMVAWTAGTIHEWIETRSGHTVPERELMLVLPDDVLDSWSKSSPRPAHDTLTVKRKGHSSRNGYLFAKSPELTTHVRLCRESEGRTITIVRMSIVGVEATDKQVQLFPGRILSMADSRSVAGG